MGFVDGEQLQRTREEMGWTQYWLADALGVKRSRLAHWERGRARVPPRVAVLVRRAQKHVMRALESLDAMRRGKR
jgi:transcriptional regulator with XRE-family HTH domain